MKLSRIFFRILNGLLLISIFISCTKGPPPSLPNVKSTPLTSTSDFEKNCFEHRVFKDCLEVKMSSQNSNKAFLLACENNQPYGCTLIGQHHENNAEYPSAITYYKKACDSKEQYGCDFLKSIHMKLCYDLKQLQYCNVFQPEGNYAIIEFLKTENHKLIKVFVEHNFSYEFDKEIMPYYLAALKKGSVPLIQALLVAVNGGKQDGASAEGLYSILGGKILYDHPLNFIKALILEPTEEIKRIVIQDEEAFNTLDCADVKCKKMHIASIQKKILGLSKINVSAPEKVIRDKILIIIKEHLKSI